MKGAEVLQIRNQILAQKDPRLLLGTLPTNPLKPENPDFRPNTVVVEDAFFGDSGKGAVTAKFNELLMSKEGLYSLRYNGGANSGHETVVDGKKVVVHQLPVAVVKEGATALLTRGALLHPQDLVEEIGQIKNAFGGRLLGTLIIDERTPLSLDTHRAYEATLNIFTSGGRGSTGRGIAPGYASLYERTVVTMKDLMSEKWEAIFRQHYHLYRMMIQGFGVEIEQIGVPSLGGSDKQPVGGEGEFIDRLTESRRELKPYISPQMFFLLQEVWNQPQIPLTIEGAQGAGLDPYHGVYPDVTASRPMSYFLPDATYGVVRPELIEARLAATKTTYVSSVGQRRLPTRSDEEYARWIQETFDERGRSTGRLRDIYEVSIPIAQYLRGVAGYRYLVVTHLDASRENTPIKVVTHYTDKVTGEEMPYLPYQDFLDRLEPHIVEFPGWDGKAVKQAKSPADLPYEARVYLAFLSKTIAPVALGTTGPELGSYISWIPDL